MLALPRARPGSPGQRGCETFGLKRGDRWVNEARPKPDSRQEMHSSDQTWIACRLSRQRRKMIASGAVGLMNRHGIEKHRSPASLDPPGPTLMPWQPTEFTLVSNAAAAPGRTR
jgi:hypothetical protein